MTTNPTPHITATEEMSNSFLQYSMSVITARALPDVRDGLKPVQRRIIYAMWKMGVTAQKPHRKSATVVGETIGKYHPHSNDAIYEALVRNGATPQPPTPTHQPARQLRYCRRPTRRYALHRMPSNTSRGVAARRHRREHSQHDRHIRQRQNRTRSATRTVPRPASERKPRNRCRDGHQHTTPQSRRNPQRGPSATSNTPTAPTKTS